MKRIKLIKPAIFTVAIIAGATAVFMGATQTIIKAEYNNVEKTDISYSIAGIAANTNSRPVPEGYVKANYIVSDSIYGSETPSISDIPRDAAAETGVQALYELYQLDMEGNTISMSYYSAGNGMRAQWNGTYWADGIGNYTDAYSFTVDSITGELLTATYERFPSVENLNSEDNMEGEEFNIEIHENPQRYEVLAASYAEKLNIIAGPIEKAEYHNQSFGYESAFINVFVYGENGERAFLAIDSKDDVLVGVAYNAGCLQLDELDRWVKEEAQKVQ